MNILIVNEHSALNLGDDAIMYETFKSLRAAYPDSTMTLAANDPASWQRYTEAQIVGSLATWVVDRKDSGWRWRKALMALYVGLLTLAGGLYCLIGFRLLFGRAGQRHLLQAYYDADLVLSCGGGVFYAYRPMSPGFLWALLSLAFAKFLGKRTVMLPQSVGPVEGQVQRWLARLLFDRIDHIMLRERRSLAFLKELGVSRPAILIPDLAFGLPSVPKNSSLIPVKGASLRIGATVIDRAAQTEGFTRQRSYEDAMVSLLVKLSQEYGADIYLFSQCYGPTRDQDDRHSARRIYERVRREASDVTLVDPFPNALELKKAYSNMDCMIGSRTHTGIFALSSGVPIVLIAYQPKAFGVMASFGLERYCCDIETVTAKRLSSLVHQVLANRHQIEAHLLRRYAKTREMLRDWVSYL